jgi:hypothetical protein
MARFDGTHEAPTLTLEVDPSSLTDFTLDLSLLDGPAPLGPNPAWTSLPMTDVDLIAIRRGRSREDQPNDAGTMTVSFDNRLGYYDPDNGNPSNPYSSSGASWFRAGLPARLRATWGGNTYYLFKGRLEDPQTDLGAEPTATFTFVDGIADVASDLTGFYPQDETTAQRADRALDLLGWPSADRMILGSRVLLTGLGAATTGLGVLEDCAAAEAGRFYVDAQGRMRLADLADALTRSVKVTFADDDSSGSVDYSSIKTSPGVKYVVNESTVTNGTYSATVTNTTSIAQTRVRRAQNRTSPLADSSDIDSLATYLANHRATPSTRVEQIVAEALGIGSAWDGLLDLDLGDRVRAKRTGTNGIGLDVTLAVEGVSHTISAASWQVALSTAPIDTTGSEFTLDVSLLNGSDVLA